MPSPFKPAKKRNIPEKAAHMARLLAEERKLVGDLEANPKDDHARAVLTLTQAEIGHVRREGGGYTKKNRRRRRHTVKKQRGCRRGRL
jgi:hypothetical protein